MQEVQEKWVQSLGWEHPWRRKWQPTTVFLPGKFHGQRSLMGYTPWGCKELGTTEHTHTHTHTHNMKFAILTILSVQFSSVKYIHSVAASLQNSLCHVKQTLYPVSNCSPLPRPHPLTITSLLCVFMNLTLGTSYKQDSTVFVLL